MRTAPKNIFLGISGGIAAYKTPELVRRLRERGAEVQVVMTQSAREFVTEARLPAQKGHPCSRFGVVREFGVAPHS